MPFIIPVIAVVVGGAALWWGVKKLVSNDDSADKTAKEFIIQAKDKTVRFSADAATFLEENIKFKDGQVVIVINRGRDDERHINISSLSPIAEARKRALLKELPPEVASQIEAIRTDAEMRPVVIMKDGASASACEAVCTAVEKLNCALPAPKDK